MKFEYSQEDAEQYRAEHPEIVTSFKDLFLSHKASRVKTEEAKE